MTSHQGVWQKIQRFIFPSFTPKSLIRVFLVALFACLFFNTLCIPFRIQGGSMEPTYRDGGINLCWRYRYLFAEPKRFDVVNLRFAGENIMLLKRIVALEGEQVEFRGGKLFVDGREIEEPYVSYPCDWDVPPMQVEKGYVYLVGDNRSMPQASHYFGKGSKNRIMGGPLW
jgi:signal peptidase I